MVICTWAAVSACDLSDLLKSNTTLAHKIHSLEIQGFVLVLDDRTFYNQIKYLVVPTPPYVDGNGQVTMMRKHGGLSLTTDYTTITFDGIVRKNNRCATSNIAVSYQTIY